MPSFQERDFKRKCYTLNSIPCNAQSHFHSSCFDKNAYRDGAVPCPLASRVLFLMESHQQRCARSNVFVISLRMKTFADVLAEPCYHIEGDHESSITKRFLLLMLGKEFAINSKCQGC
jgi:hypothetical protein